MDALILAAVYGGLFGFGCGVLALFVLWLTMFALTHRW